jgi:hypothetical protein
VDDRTGDSGSTRTRLTRGFRVAFHVLWEGEGTPYHPTMLPFLIPFQATMKTTTPSRSKREQGVSGSILGNSQGTNPSLASNAERRCLFPI